MKVLCAGLAVTDIIVKPVSPEILSVYDTVTADAIEQKAGGDALNVACNLSSMGVDVSLVTGFGKDPFGDFLLRELERKGVGTADIIISDKPTSVSAVLISPSGDRCFISRKGACHALKPSDITDEMMEGHDVLYVGSVGDLPEFSAADLSELFRRARGKGLVTALDVTGEVDRHTMEELEPVFPYLSVFLPSLREARNMTGETDPERCLRVLREKGVAGLALKMGADGSAVLSGDKYVTCAPYDSPCIDTTGAGDAFVAGYIAGMTMGLDPVICSKIGNVTGGRTVSVLGAQAELGPLGDILETIGYKEN